MLSFMEAFFFALKIIIERIYIGGDLSLVQKNVNLIRHIFVLCHMFYC